MLIIPYLLLLGLVGGGRNQAVHSCCGVIAKHAFKFNDLLALISDAIAGVGQPACASSIANLLLLDLSRRPLDYDHRFISRELC